MEDDVVECTTEVEEECEDETSGYTTNTKCSKWPREVCSVSKKPVKKYTPITGCTKEPRELCAPAGCGFKQGAEECYDKVQIGHQWHSLPLPLRQTDDRAQHWSLEVWGCPSCLL